MPSPGRLPDVEPNEPRPGVPEQPSGSDPARLPPGRAEFGWATDDPRWGDARAGGLGRLDPTPPPAFGPPLAISATADDEVRPAVGTASVPGALPLPAPVTRLGAATPPPLAPTSPTWPAGTVPDPRPAPLLPGLGAPAATLRPGYGLLVRTGEDAVAGTERGHLAGGPRPTRLERQVRLRRRRGRDDEFYQATRAELLSDDARYQVLFALTAAWYAPALVIAVVWTLITGGQLLTVLAWLAGGALLALAIAGLLRWAQVSWRALNLSLAAAIIGGAVVTIAHTLSG